MDLKRNNLQIESMTWMSTNKKGVKGSIQFTTQSVVYAIHPENQLIFNLPFFFCSTKSGKVSVIFVIICMIKQK